MAKKRKKRGKKKPRIDIFEETTARIIAMIEKDGIAPWHKAWNGQSGMPTNLKTGKVYRGINVFTLSFCEYGSHYWLTFKQAKELAVKQARKTGRKIREIVKTKDGRPCRPWYLDEQTGEAFMGGIRKGEKKFGYVVFWKNMVARGEGIEGGEDGERENDRVIPMLKYTPIFNVEQTDGIEIPKPPERKDFSPVKECEKLLEAYKHAPRVVFGGNRAYYSPQLDYIKMPDPEEFDAPENYYNVLFHEHVHGTGHASRLARKTLMNAAYFGSHQYSEEELVAEMGASFLAARTGIDTKPIVENTAAYLKYWLGKLKKEPKLLVHSASRAQRAFDHITNVTFAEKSDTDDEDKVEVVTQEMEIA